MVKDEVLKDVVMTFKRDNLTAQFQKFKDETQQCCTGEGYQYLLACIDTLFPKVEGNYIIW